MKSQKLTNDLRNKITHNIYIDKYKSKNDELQKQRRIVGTSIIKNAFGDGVYSEMKKLPEGFFVTTSAFTLNIDAHDHEVLTNSLLCPSCYKYNPITTDDRIEDKSIINARNQYRGEYKTIENEIKKHNEWWNTTKEEINKVLYSVNTTKQLLEIWPECEKYLPDYVKNVDNTHLPMVQVTKLNTLLGIKGEQK